MDRRTKLIWCVASVLPAVGLVAVLILKSVVIPAAEAEADAIPGMEDTVVREAATGTAVLLVVRPFTLLITMAMMIVTFVRLLNAPAMETREKAIWVVLLLLPWLSLPAYWYIHIRQAPERGT